MQAGVDTQGLLACKALLLAGPVQRLFPRRQDCRQGRHAGACLDHAMPPLADARHLAQPVEDMDLHLGSRRRCLPEHALRGECRRQPFRQNRGRTAVRREIGEETRMLPVGDMRDDEIFEIGEDRLDRFPVNRRCGGKRFAHLAGAGLRAHRARTQRVEIGCGPCGGARSPRFQIAVLHLQSPCWPEPAAMKMPMSPRLVPVGGTFRSWPCASR